MAYTEKNSLGGLTTSDIKRHSVNSTGDDIVERRERGSTLSENTLAWIRLHEQTAHNLVTEKMNSLNETLAVRGSRYGEFDEQARVTQNIKAAMRDSANWKNLPPIMREALEMDASKTARILNGDFNYDDSWHDKAGYATLVENFLHKIFKKA